VRRLLLVLMLMLLVSPGTVGAQVPAAECIPKTPIINGMTNGAAIPIGATAVAVLGRSDVRCKMLLRNAGTAPMACLPENQGAPTASRGQVLMPGDQLNLETSGRGAWQCIRTTGTDTTANTIEEVP
jgi:hypothetical protein